MLLEIEDVHKSYALGSTRTDVLRGVSFQLGSGQTMALMGESGSGKSTLLHLAGGLDLPDRGDIRLSAAPVNVPSDTMRAQMRAAQIGIVFQQFNLIPSLTVSANISFQAQLAGVHDPAWCAELARGVGVADQLEKYPEALSGGQQQRVAIARALAAKPKLVLADEPTGNLDEATSDAVLKLMVSFIRETGTALLMVTHSSQHARLMDSQLRLSGGVIAA